MQHLKIFDKSFYERASTAGVVIPTGYTSLQRNYQWNKDTIENYYNTRTFAVKNSHILARITSNLPILLQDDNLTFSSMLQGRTPYVSKTFQLTSPINNGIVHEPHFYANNGKEVLISVDKPLNLAKVRNNWRKESCIKVYQHPRNDTRLLLPFGIDDGSKGGMSVIALDLNILGLKYREFMKEQVWNEQSDKVVLNVDHFIAKYVITGSLESDIDHRILNRVMDTYYGNPSVVPRYKHKFPIHEPTTLLDRYTGNVLDRITSSKLTFEAILMNIPLMFSMGAFDLLTVDSMPMTRQVKWSVYLSRLKYLCFIYDVAKEKSMGASHISEWKYSIRRFEGDGGFHVIIPEPYRTELQGYIDKIKDM